MKAKVIISSPDKESLKKAIQRFLYSDKEIDLRSEDRIIKGEVGELKNYLWREKNNRFQLIEI